MGLKSHYDDFSIHYVARYLMSCSDSYSLSANYEKEFSQVRGSWWNDDCAGIEKADQKVHWILYMGGRWGKSGGNDSFRECYRYVSCDFMLIWLLEAIGVDDGLLESIVSEAKELRRGGCKKAVSLIRGRASWNDVVAPRLRELGIPTLRGSRR